MIEKRDGQLLDPRIILTLIIGCAMFTPAVMAGVVIPLNTIDPRTIPQFVDPLVIPPEWTSVTDPNPTAGTYDYYEINVSQFQQQILPAGFPSTTVWGYGGQTAAGFVRHAPAGTFNVTRNTSVKIKWINDLTGNHLYPVDPTLHWASPDPDCMMVMPMMGAVFPNYPPGFIGQMPWNCTAQYPVPISTHVHGNEVKSDFDGGPEQWWTWNGTRGPDYRSLQATDANAAIYYYNNNQPTATLWYHDHALGITRINVLSGLARFYLLHDQNDPIASQLPSGAYDIPLAIQDRTFWAINDPSGNNAYKAGDFWIDQVGLNPTVHPYWMPEFFGNTIMVNGRVWPHLNVSQTTYRFRILDGSNARFYTLSFQDATGAKIPFQQIATDPGYLPAPVTMNQLTIAPGERAEILINFTGVTGPVIMRNTARYPFPKGAVPNPGTDGTIMQFNVGPTAVTSPVVPATLNTIPVLPAPTVTRTRVLWEVMGPLGPLEVLVNGQKWAGQLSENPAPGATEDWIVVNPTADTHPIHLHLAPFQLVSRQAFDVKKYSADWVAKQYTDCAMAKSVVPLTPCGSLTPPAMGMMRGPPWPNNYTPLELDVTPYLKGKATLPAANELGWKDTIQMNPGEVSIIRVRFSPIDGSAGYPFLVTDGPGYVWHCHIIDHEDNEMMRRFVVGGTAPPAG